MRQPALATFRNEGVLLTRSQASIQGKERSRLASASDHAVSYKIRQSGPWSRPKGQRTVLRRSPSSPCWTLQMQAQSVLTARFRRRSARPHSLRHPQPVSRLPGRGHLRCARASREEGWCGTATKAREQDSGTLLHQMSNAPSSLYTAERHCCMRRHHFSSACSPTSVHCFIVISPKLCLLFKPLPGFDRQLGTG